MSMEPFFTRLQTGEVPNLEETMRYEGLRLATFHKRPRCNNTSASKLANAGFYYTGKADVVACYKCGLQIGSWESIDPFIDPLALHMDRSPDCPFVMNSEKENIPYAVEETQQCEEVKKLKQQISAKSTARQLSDRLLPLALNEAAQNRRTFQEQLSGSTELPGSNQRPGYERNISTDAVEADRSNSQQNSNRYSTAFTSSTGSNSTYSGLFDRQDRATWLSHQTSSPLRSPFELPQPPPLFDSSEVQGSPNYKDEQTRLDSYSYWPNGAAVRPMELARAGFYYLGTEDRVQCAFCKGVLRNWDPTDHAMDEHKKHFPACPFIKDPKGVGNVPLINQLSGVSMRKENESTKELEDYLISIMTERAYHPHMAMTVERLNSFVNFISDSNRTPEEFADAGFFFTGQGDNVKCFFCDGGLRNWERNDDPWLEHARWFPKCGYLRTKKGEEYVKEIRKRYSPPGAKKPRIRKLRTLFAVKPEAVEEFMRSDVVENVHDMGYTLSLIRATVRRRFAELGTAFPNEESLVNSILEAEELEKQGSDSDSDSGTPDEYLRHYAEGEKTEANLDAIPGETSNSSNSDVVGKTEKKKKRKKRNKKKNESAAHINPIELMSDEKGSELASEVQKMRDERMCKVCMDGEVNVVFLKCGHLVCCSDCAPALRHCPICRETIRGTIRVFLS